MDTESQKSPLEEVVKQSSDKPISAETTTDKSTELKAFTDMVSAIQTVPEQNRSRLITSVLTFIGWNDFKANTSVPNHSAPAGAPVRNDPAVSSFSEDRTISPKEFMFQKKPVTDIEKITCLAFYLTHYRDTPHFKTLDLSKLNTEAAQIKFSNAAKAVDNATFANLLVAAGKGAKQISSLGEMYVQQLPDRVAAKEAIAHAKPRRKQKRIDGTKE